MTIEQYHQIADWLRRLIDGTEFAGHVYAVGGCVRDELMGRPINDVDLAVDLPDGGVRLAAWLDEQGLTLGAPTVFARYGTAMLRLREFPDHEIEMVQTRCGKYTAETADNPSAVFGSVRDDCLRRDLTINSLFRDITTGRILDLTGNGRADIAAHLLRTPMAPEQTFADDPVRTLRVVRMACALGWDIDAQTLKAMRGAAAGLQLIKAERLRAEVEKMLQGPDPARALTLMRQTGLLRHVAPELDRLVRNDPAAWQTALRAVNALERCGRLATALAAMLRPLADRSARDVERSLRRLHYHTPVIKAVNRELGIKNKPKAKQTAKTKTQTKPKPKPKKTVKTKNGRNNKHRNLDRRMLSRRDRRGDDTQTL